MAYADGGTWEQSDGVVQGVTVMRQVVRKWGYLCVLAMAWPWLAPAQQAASTVTPPAASTPAPTGTALPAIPFAAADAAAVAVPSAANAWGGGRSGSEPTLSDRVASYRIDAELDAAKHAVTGRERMTWRNRSDRPVDRIYVHLYLNAFQNEGSTWFTEREVLTAHGR